MELSASNRAKINAGKQQLLAERAWDQMEREVKEATAARAQLPVVLAKLEAVETALARPLAVSATLKQPAKVKGTVKVPRLVDAVFDFATAEFIRRAKQTPIADTLNVLRPGDSNRLMRKSATDLATTTASGWATELVESGQLAWVEELVSVFGAMAKGGQPLPMGNKNSVTAPFRPVSDKGSMYAAFTDAGASLPHKSGKLASKTFLRMKCGVLSTFTSELAETSVPMISDIIKSMVLQDTADMLDTVILDPANAGVAGIRPASPWNGAPTQPSIGSAASDVIRDITWLIGQISASRPRKPVLIIDHMRFQRLRMILESGVYVFRDEVERGELFGIPLLVSPNVPDDQVYIIDLADFTSWSPPPEIDLSNAATVVLASDDGVAPTMSDTNAINDVGGSIHISDASGKTPPAKVMSAFQAYAEVLRHVQPISWGLVRSGTVAWLSTVVW